MSAFRRKALTVAVAFTLFTPALSAVDGKAEGK